jgi:surfeit locus 1 family protein
MAPPPAKLYELGQASGGRIRQNLATADYSRELGLLLLPVSVQQTDGSDDGLLRSWPRIAAGVEKHHGYAFQWFGLSALIAVLYVWFQIVRPLQTRRR